MCESVGCPSLAEDVVNVELKNFHDLHVTLLGGQGACARVILVLFECIWNVTAASLVLPAFGDTGYLGSPYASRGLSPCFNGSTLGDCTTRCLRGIRWLS